MTKKKQRVSLMSDRVIFYNIRGYKWVQFGIARKWRWRHHGWIFRGLVRDHQYGPLWIATLHSDALARVRERA